MRPVGLATPAVFGNLAGVPSAIGSHSTSGSARKAVFLSYASEDAEAARRLCEALRANGIEVWFDEADLQGGENWEAQIKKRIHECTLFMPIVSVQTQSRLEGYFRREWDLASERTHDMAATVPFLVPVAIDETSETNAEVPDEFFRAHWMRLPRALPTPEFVGQIERLLRSLPSGAPRSPAPTARPAARPRRWLWAALAALLVIGAGTVAVWERPTPVAPAAGDRSIAVLPFENLSEDKSNGYFADGVQEDILTDLANLGGLKVISRTSVLQYRDTKKPLLQIGEELGVAYVLEGSVRRAGNQVRVTGQLINARTEGHVWANTYDHEFELKEIFAVQSALAEQIAVALHTVLTPEKKARLESGPTQNTAAYDLYLKGREQFITDENVRDSVARMEPLFAQAVELDPNFALAWLWLARTHLRAYNMLDHSAARFATYKACLDTAVRLAPQEPEVLLGLGNYYEASGDLARAQTLYLQVVQEFPNNADALVYLSYVARKEGRWSDALADLRKAVILDPRSLGTQTQLDRLLYALRHYDEMEQRAKLLEGIGEPKGLVARYYTAWESFQAHGSGQAMDALVGGISPEARRSDPDAVTICAQWAFTRGDAAGLIHLWEGAGSNWHFSFVGSSPELIPVAQAFLKLGEPGRARPLLEENRDALIAQLATQPENRFIWCDLALCHAMLGDQTAARATLAKLQVLLDKTTELPATVDANLAVVYAWLGDRKRAADLLAASLRLPQVPDFARVPSIRRGIGWWPLQDDPAFKAVLDDPQNNAPLF